MTHTTVGKRVKRKTTTSFGKARASPTPVKAPSSTGTISPSKRIKKRSSRSGATTSSGEVATPISGGTGGEIQPLTIQESVALTGAKIKDVIAPLESGIRAGLTGQPTINPESGFTKGAPGAAITQSLGALGAFILPGLAKGTKATKLAKPGLFESIKITATNIATNTATKAKTTSWLTRLGQALVSPVAVAGTLVASIGSYPFAGFIKEEALQTIGFATVAAARNEDIPGAEAALDLQREVLDPDLWNQILGAIPFVNVLANLEDFYDAARLKLTIDEKVIGDLKVQIATGETDDQKFARIRQEESDAYQANTDYRLQQQFIFNGYERDARREQRNEDAAFWAKQAAEQRKLEAEDREQIALFWLEYRKELARIQEDSRPSKLNFGII